MSSGWLWLSPFVGSENPTEPLVQSTAMETIDASGSATEQSGMDLDISEPLKIPQSTAGIGLATEQSEGGSARFIPIVEVAFDKDYWLALPKEISAHMFAQFDNDQDAIYTWDFGGRQETSIKGHSIDFAHKEQRNMDNGRMRTIRLIWVEDEDTQPQWTGKR